jgi:hypothetical protein
VLLGTVASCKPSVPSPDNEDNIKFVWGMSRMIRGGKSKTFDKNLCQFHILHVSTVQFNSAISNSEGHKVA